MRAYDQSDDELHLKSIFHSRKILDNLIRDMSDLFARDNLLYFLRITVLICGYLVLRPVIEATFRRFMQTSQDKTDNLDSITKTQDRPVHKSLAEELLLAEGEDQEDARGVSTPQINTGASEWGSTMRKRQQTKFMEAWEVEQARRAEEEELRELDDILED